MTFRDWMHELDSGNRTACLAPIDDESIELSFDDTEEGVELSASDARKIGERLIAFAEWAENAECPFCAHLPPFDRGCWRCDAGHVTRAEAAEIEATLRDVG